MKKVVYLFLLLLISNLASAQEVQIEIEKLGKYSSTSWSIMDAFGQNIISSADFDDQDFVMSLEANTKFYFNVNVDYLSENDTSLYFIKLDNEPIILINNDLEIGDHSYSFFTGKKSPELRIIGGTTASIEDFPWQAFFASGNFLCGGTIISKKWILTAAHCVFDEHGSRINTSVMSVKVGTSYPYRSWMGKNYNVKNVIVHENYYVKDIEYDIAILELEDYIDFENAEPIELIASEDVANGATDPGVMSKISGWGLTKTNPDLSTSVLNEVELPIVSSTSAAVIWGKVDSSILMAGYKFGGKDACSGDSGGPLVVDVDGDPKLAGIVSWGSEDCDTYGGYTRVSSYLDWIYEKTGMPRPIKLSAPLGIYSVCDKRELYSYFTDSVKAYFYQWELLPISAGILSFDDDEASVTWSDDYYGTAQLRVRARVSGRYTLWSKTEVKILEPTNILYQTGDQIICDQDSAALYVFASGTDLKYNWYKNDVFYNTTDNDSLIFAKANAENSGLYYCNIEGVCGSQNSEEIELTVYPITEIYSAPEDKQGLQNENITLSTLSYGHDLIYQWYKDGVPIADDGNNNFLELTDVNASDIGQYWIEANGTCGSDVSDSIYFFVDLQENNLSSTVKIWPTLTQNTLNVAINNSELYSISIYNGNGEMLYRNGETAYQTTIDVSAWADGLYIVKITSTDLDSTFKFIKY